MATAGIYVSPWDVGGPTHENIVIRDNILYHPSDGAGRASAASRWLPLSLSKNKGRYRVHGNRVMP